MSDLSITLDALERSRSQLSVSSYFDEALFRQRAAAHLRARPALSGPRAGRARTGDFHALPQEGEGRALLRTARGIELISNVCRHRQAVILRGRGNSRAATSSAPCTAGPTALHGPELLGAPHFRARPLPAPEQLRAAVVERPAVRGRRRATSPPTWPASGRAPSSTSAATVLDRVQLHECDYNWKTFIEVYLEDYHVGPFHPGLGNFVTCDDLRWEFGRDHSVQTVGVANARGKALGQPGSTSTSDGTRRCSTTATASTPKHGAIWLTYYPHVMVEWYPHVLVVSTLYPARAAEDAEHGGVLLSRGDRRLRARIRRGAAGRLHGDLRRGRRDRRCAWTPAGAR